MKTPQIVLCLALMMGWAGCLFDSETKRDPDPVAPYLPASRLLAVTSDFQSGAVRGIGRTVDPLNLAVFQDAAIRIIGNRVFILERFGASTIMEIDPSGAGRVISQTSLGNPQLNPVDMVEGTPGKFYVSLQNGTALMAGPAEGPFSPINLSAYANPGQTDGVPHMDQMVAAYGKVFVLIQRGKPSATGWGSDFDSVGLVVELNPVNDQVIRVHRLHHPNPGAIARVDSVLYILTRGSPYVCGDGGIEKIDLRNDSLSLVALESAFGTDVLGLGDLTWQGGTRFYISLSHPWNGSSSSVQVWLVDFADGSVIHRLGPVSDGWGGVAYSRADNRVCVGDRGTGSEGVRIFDGTTGAQLFGPVSAGLAPYGMQVLE